MRFNPLMTAIFTGAIFMESVDIMAGGVRVSVVYAASMMN